MNGRAKVSLCDFLRERVSGTVLSSKIYDYGTVKSCGDNIVRIDGLSKSRYGEILEFDGGEYGLAMNLGIDGVGAVLFEGQNIVPGSKVRRTGHISDICVGSALLGRVIDPLGRPLDGKELHCTEYRQIEQPAPTIMQRSPVNTPMETGILAVDSMIPIGRGQRELIIGDRRTGKTSIAVSAMLNQRAGNMKCVYCAIGQKASSVANIAHIMETEHALENLVIVASFADDSAAMQYIAPYAACAIAEKFMYDGEDVLIVYDDLSKHAAAYRAMSLLLRRPSGREAYPGDVFYLHSRLLERSAKLSPELGGGSMTALPIVETLAGDISAYIPTNVISITDGQIFLETELFNAGMRPAVNVGLSVSRVGRNAQSKAIKSVSAKLRLEIARYRDMAVFAQFGADIDAATENMLRNGERLTELLKQDASILLSCASQTAVLLAFEHGVFASAPVHTLNDIEEALLKYLYAHAQAEMNRINQAGELSEETKKTLIKCFDEFTRLNG